MAGYVLSDDVKFSGISSDVEAQVLSYRSSMDLDSLTAVFNSADFPLSSETQWPESFSYEKQGTIYFSPVSYTHLDVYKRQVRTCDKDDRNIQLCTCLNCCQCSFIGYLSLIHI